jgi:chromosome segregation protein
MRLQRLELFGFKSFADRTALVFDHPLTGIVGPNGCGKSNVVDAVRWVLGETRPTSMRGGEMSDVVFKGSVSRPALSVAEVTLVLRNEVGELAGRGSEVAITRRVYLSGEGEYLIDGERVRLKDVRDMLFDTGLGSRGYAVLEQGRIDAVLSANPLDRRAVFEEAAGISRYRQRRKETEARLKRVEQDLERLDDVLRELASRVRSLKIQAGKAERFLAAREEWRSGRTRFARHRLALQHAEMERLGGALAELERRGNELRALREGGEGDAAQREREQQTLAAEVDRWAGEVARLAAEARACDERCVHLGQRAESARRSGQEEARRALELASALEVREADLERLGEQVLARRAALESAEQHLASEQSRLEIARERVTALRARAEAVGNEALRHYSERTEAHNSVRHLEAAQPALEERAQRVGQRLDETRGVLSELAGERAESEARLASSEGELERASERAASLERELQSVAAAAEAAVARRAELEIESARLASRIDALRDWEREREALEAGGRALLEAVERGAAPCAPDALAGLVADHLRTGTELARALDAALGASALALVIRDASEAARVAAWLAERKAGMVRLTTPAGLAPAEAVDSAWRDGLGESEREAVAGTLLESIEVEPGFESLARWLVGDVLVVRDLGAALELVARHPRWRCVTPQGELVDALGLIGGHREIAQGAIGRRASAAELERELARTRKALAGAEREQRDLAERGSALEGEQSAARALLERCREALGEARSRGQTARARLADLEQTLAQLERDRAHLEGERGKLESELASARDRLQRSSAIHAERAAALAELEGERGSAEAELGALQEGLALARSEVARSRAELEGLGQRSADLERVRRESTAELERARRLAREHEAAANQASASAQVVRADGDGLLIQRGDAERRLEELRSAEREGREAIDVHRQRVDAVTREIEALAEQLSGLRLEAQRVELERAELCVRVREELDLGPEQLLAGFEPEPELADPAALSALGEAVAEHKRRLDSIGPVNTEALAELEGEAKRLEFLEAQRKDLARAKQSLDEALATINAESLRLFTQTFDDVRAHFQVLFRQLFGGGRADLELSTDGDPLECGIEITARPPGREMLPIGLLSGGQRTMTALALLFAVFRARPSPFCVLDEVDAALDDANVGRFLAMLDGFLAETQFLVVTHNKGTMAACDALYGITMETKGVSSHVAVEFGEVERLVPEATGNAAAAASARTAARGAESQADLEPAQADGERVVELVPQAPPLPEPVEVQAGNGQA